jgi:ribosomal protein S13
MLKKLKLSKNSKHKFCETYGINSRINIFFLKDKFDNKIMKLNTTKSAYPFILYKKNINSYIGSRHKKSLPVRGQRTHTNAKTNKKNRKHQTTKFGTNK